MEDAKLTDLEFEALWLSLRIATVATLAALPLALLAAYVLARGRFHGRLLLDALIHLPLVLPPVVIGYLLLLTFGRQGPLGAWLLEQFGLRLVFSWQGAALAAAVVSFPFQVRAIRLALEEADTRLEQMAATLGAGSIDIFFSVTLPRLLPGLIAGMTTAFAACLGEFGAIITFAANVPGETRTLPLAIYSALQTPGGEVAAARLALLSIALALTGLMLSEWLLRRLR